MTSSEQTDPESSDSPPASDCCEPGGRDGVDEGFEEDDGRAGGTRATDRSRVEAREETARLDVPTMDCASCAGKVENALSGVAGVTSVDTRPATGSVVVGYDPDAAGNTDLVRAIEGAGYDVADGAAGGDADATVGGRDGRDDEHQSVWRGPRATRTWVSAGFVAVGLLLRFLLPAANVHVVSVLGRGLGLADVLFLIAVAVCGQAILRDGYCSLVHRSLDMDLLMSMAIVGALLTSVAFGESFYFEAAMLAVLVSVAELLERYSMEQARRSLRELVDLSPREATVRRDGEERTVPVDAVEVGDVVVVRPGEMIPMDGEVFEGRSAVDQAPVTGESVPVDKTVGDEVFAGTVNGEGYLELTATTRAEDNTISRIVRLVEDAQANRTEREQFVDRFAGYYTPTVVGFAAVVAFVPPLFFGAPWPTYLVYGLTLLVLACPCAFVISTPVSVVSGITSAANNGVLVKGGNHLEAMGEVGAVALDKTGTLTRGDLVVTDVVPLNGHTRESVLRSARDLEARSEHPIGRAIVAEADGTVAAPERTVDDFESITGRGVRATLDGTTHVAGSPALFEDLGFDLSHVHATTDGGTVTATARGRCERDDCLDLRSEAVPDLKAQGKTVVLVGTEDELAGVVAVADEVRPDARRAVQRLHDLGVEHVVVLTGDDGRTARAIAEEVGVDEFRAGLLPEEKVEAVDALAAEYGSVAMVGDGVNDAPALATATVGIAMGAAGTDTALETADVALMGDDLTKLPYLYDLSHRANGVIRQNVATSLAAKALLALAVPFGLVPIWAAVLFGDAGMTSVITGNAMRLSWVDPRS